MTKELLVSILSGSAAAAVVSGITSVVLWYLNNRKKDDEKIKNLTDGVQVLLYDRIKYLGVHHIEAGEIAPEDLEDLQRMHKTYHDQLGGNGYLDTIMSKVKKLPVVVKKGA